MPTIDIERRHSVGRETARKAAEEIAESLKEKLQATYRWNGDDLVFERTGAKGHIHVSDDVVRVEIDLSFVLRPIKGKVEKKVHHYLDKYLSG